MGLCFTRDKEDYIMYERYVDCETCLRKIPYNRVYVTAHCLNKTHLFCSRECYGRLGFKQIISAFRICMQNSMRLPMIV